MKIAYIGVGANKFAEQMKVPFCMWLIIIFIIVMYFKKVSLTIPLVPTKSLVTPEALEDFERFKGSFSRAVVLQSFLIFKITQKEL